MSAFSSSAPPGPADPPDFPDPGAPPEPGSLAPGLLVASPPLGDPNFDRTVVLLALHGEGGALGFVINRISPVSLGELLSLGGYGDIPEGDETPVYIGGPVQPGSGWILTAEPEEPGELEARSAGEGLIRLGERVRVTSSRRGFDALALDACAGVGARKDPKRRLVLLGYSGWGPGQLEREIASGSWLPVPFDEDTIFEVDASEKWEKAYGLLGLTPSAMLSMNRAGEA